MKNNLSIMIFFWHLEKPLRKTVGSLIPDQEKKTNIWKGQAYHEYVPIICHQCLQNCCWYHWLATGINNTSVTGGKIFVDTCGKFATSVVDTSCATWLANISTNFWKNLKQPLCWGKMIHEKNLKQKNLVTLSPCLRCTNMFTRYLLY